MAVTLSSGPLHANNFLTPAPLQATGSFFSFGAVLGACGLDRVHLAAGVVDFTALVSLKLSQNSETLTVGHF